MGKERSSYLRSQNTTDFGLLLPTAQNKLESERRLVQKLRYKKKEQKQEKEIRKHN